jgi:hypothetical protein
VPINYVYRSLSDDELVGLYRAADVMVVTPVRDGMNLVAKEFVAARPDEDGVLVLSEFAGAAAELREALLVNPFAIDQLAETYARALSPAGRGAAGAHALAAPPRLRVRRRLVGAGLPRRARGGDRRAGAPPRLPAGGAARRARAHA